MDLRRPLRSLAPSLDSAVLEVLAGTESWLGASQIQRLAARGTRAGQTPVLARLVEHGLVTAEPASHGFMYRLNREHVLAPVILAANRTRSIVLERLRGELDSLAPTPLHASVYGSFARGEAGVASDIDILVLGRDESDREAWSEQISLVEERILRFTGNGCQCLVLDTDRARELAANGEPIVSSWLGEGELLLGQSLGHLIVA